MAVIDPVAGFVSVLGALAMIGGLALGLRWTWGTGKDQHGPHVPDPDDPTGDGLLTEVCRVPTPEAAAILRARLATAGVRATVGRDAGEFRLLVFHLDVVTARLVLQEQ